MEKLKKKLEGEFFFEEKKLLKENEKKKSSKNFFQKKYIFFRKKKNKKKKVSEKKFIKKNSKIFKNKILKKIFFYFFKKKINMKSVWCITKFMCVCWNVKNTFETCQFENLEFVKQSLNFESETFYQLKNGRIKYQSNSRKAVSIIIMS